MHKLSQIAENFTTTLQLHTEQITSAGTYIYADTFINSNSLPAILKEYLIFPAITPENEKGA